MNTLDRDRNTLKRLVESYGKKDVLNFVRHLNETSFPGPDWSRRSSENIEAERKDLVNRINLYKKLDFRTALIQIGCDMQQASMIEQHISASTFKFIKFLKDHNLLDSLSDNEIYQLAIEASHCSFGNIMNLITNISHLNLDDKQIELLTTSYVNNLIPKIRNKIN